MFKPQLIVFDWDGTLLDSTGAISSAIQDAARDLGLPIPSRKAAAHVIGLALGQALKEAIPEATRAQLPELIERYKHHYFKSDASLHPFEGIPELLDRLAALNVPLAIATGKSHLGLVRALAALNWQSKFATTRCADQGNPKPHPWMLLDICSELEINVSEALIVGDTTHDLGLAKNAGAAAIAVTYGAHSEDDFELFNPLAVVHSVEDLSSLLLKMLSQNK